MKVWFKGMNRREGRLWRATRQERLATQGKVELWMWRILQTFCCDKCQKKAGAFIKSYQWKDDDLFDERGR